MLLSYFFTLGPLLSQAQLDDCINNSTEAHSFMQFSAIQCT
ncbi:hypothetical protein KC19_1G249100 [Ceratodon purpureus]|uniref:Uncharacterized protein n=1 Tax=Ceratodon purpureus TaxID=3225 RepID=A0A8T0J922_CERPU|nr:hypothetical protein KC19_1G249100 [Ceratodon purpureus]